MIIQRIEGAGARFLSMVDDMPERTTRQRWTYAEFARLPSDGKRYEVIAGELYVTPAPRPVHQHIVACLLGAVGKHADEHSLGWVLPGPIDVLFAEGDYLEPDLVFLRKDRKAILSDRGLEGPPDLVVEVTSPSTGERDRRLKRERYLHYGVPEYWVADTATERLEVYRADGSSSAHDDVVTWTPHPGAAGLTLDVPPLFRGFE